MICPQCRKAGKYNAGVEALTALIKGDLDWVEFGYAKAREWHGKCRGGTWCDCQHVIGPVINTAKTRRREEENEHDPDRRLHAESAGLPASRSLPLLELR